MHYNSIAALSKFLKCFHYLTNTNIFLKFFFYYITKEKHWRIKGSISIKECINIHQNIRVTEQYYRFICQKNSFIIAVAIYINIF